MSIPSFVLQLREAETFRRRFTWTDSLGVAINLTGCTVQVDFRERPDRATLMSLNAANGRVTVTAGIGQIDLYISAVDMVTVAFSKAVWDMKVTMANGDGIFIAEGSVLVERSVTE